MSLLFNMLSRLVIAFLPRSKALLISWLQSPSAVILEPKKIKSVTVPIVSPSFCHEVVGPDAMIFVIWMLSFKPTSSLSSFTFIKRLFSSFFTFCHKGGVICLSEVTDFSLGNLDSRLCFIQPSNLHNIFCVQGFLGDSDGKEATCNAGDPGSIPGLGRCPGVGHGNLLQQSSLENPHGQRRTGGGTSYSPWGSKESDTTEPLSIAFCMLNKQGDNKQLWHTPFPLWNQSVAPCAVLTIASWSVYRFLRRQVRWSDIPISKNFSQFVVIHTKTLA